MSAPSAVQFALTMQPLPDVFAQFAVPSAVPPLLVFPPASSELQLRIQQQWASVYQCIPLDRMARLALFCALAGLARTVRACNPQMSEQDARRRVISAIKQDKTVGNELYATKLGRRWQRVNLLFAEQSDCDFWLRDCWRGEQYEDLQTKLSETFLKDLQQRHKEWIDLKLLERHAHWRQALQGWVTKDPDDGYTADQVSGNNEGSSAPASRASSSATTVTDPRSSVCTESSPKKRARLTLGLEDDAAAAQSAAASSSSSAAARASSPTGDDAENKMADVAASSQSAGPLQSSPALRRRKCTSPDHDSFRGSPKDIDADRDSDAEQDAAASGDQVDDPFAEPEASESDSSDSSASPADAAGSVNLTPDQSDADEDDEMAEPEEASDSDDDRSDADADEEMDPSPASSAPASAVSSRRQLRTKGCVLRAKAPEPRHNSDQAKEQQVRHKKKYEPQIDDEVEISSRVLQEWLKDPSDTLTNRPQFRPPLSRIEARRKEAQEFMNDEKANCFQAPVDSDQSRALGGSLLNLYRASYTAAHRLPGLVYQAARSRNGLSSLPAKDADSLRMLARFVQTIRHDAEELQCILPFDQRVEWNLTTYGAVRVCHATADVQKLLAQLAPEAFDPDNYESSVNESTTRIMNFGCANDNGADPTTAAKDAETLTNMFRLQVHTSVALEDVQYVATQQWLHAIHGLPPPELPPWCVDRLYLKDGSENGVLTKKDGAGQRVPISFLTDFETELRMLTGDPPPTVDPPDAGGDEEKQPVATPAATKKEKKSAATPQQWTDALQHEFHSHRASQRRRYLAVGKPHNKGYFIHPLYLNELQLHRRSLAPLSHVDFDGVNTSYIYLKHGFQFFNLHIEQMLFTFVHEQLEGESIWFIVPFDDLDKLYKLAAHMYAVLWGKPTDATDDDMLLMGRAVLYSKQLFPPLSLLVEHGIRYNIVHLGPGQTLTAHGGDAHFGFSTEAIRTVSIATNVASESWLKYGLKFVREHFEWIKLVEPLVDKHEKAWGKSGKPGPFTLPERAGSKRKVVLHGPKACFEKALNLCPSNFACAFVRGLYADFDAMLHEKEPVCDYPKMLSELKAGDPRRAAAKEQLEAWSADCAAIVKLIHELRPVVKEADTNTCDGCSTLQLDAGHRCLLCLCCMGTESNKMLVDAVVPLSPLF